VMIDLEIMLQIIKDYEWKYQISDIRYQISF
jgi:hypothetical protein